LPPLSETLSELVAAREVGRRQANEHNAQLNAVFALSPDGFILFDGQQNIRFVNTAFLRMTARLPKNGWGSARRRFRRESRGSVLPARSFQALIPCVRHNSSMVQEVPGRQSERKRGSV
jgi:hypothetical protein